MAREYGHSIGSRLRLERSGTLQRLVDILADQGYEPRVTGGQVSLANCPFKALAEKHQGLVCRINHELICGLVEEAGLPGCTAVLDPAPGRCCVTLVA